MARITNEGVQAEELSAHVSSLQGVFRSALGADLSLEPATPQGQLIGALALAFTQLDELVVHVANGLSIHSSVGRQIADYGSLFSLARIPGERTTVTATLSGVANTIIPAGTRASTSNGAIFETDSQVIIGSTGTVDVFMRASEIGPIVVSVGSLTQIVDAIAGWTGITNSAAGEVGKNPETDAEYRRRYLSEIAVHGRDSLETVRARVLNTENVTGCLVRDNPTSASVTTQNVAIAARSLLVVVQGGADADVAAAIAASKPVGTPTVGSNSVNVPHPEGFNIPINFERVTEIPISVTAMLTIGSHFPSTGFMTMRQNLLQWFAGTWPVPGPGIFDQSGVSIGEELDTARLNTPLNAVPGHRIDSLTVVRVAGMAALGVPNLNERYTLDSANITFAITP